MLDTGGNAMFIEGTHWNALDYGLLMSHLQTYKAPHRKISRLLKSGDLIRVKKGLYVLGEQPRQSPLCREWLANLIYGPSYVSQEYALAYYGLIPERVNTVTSMTCKRHKKFDTPLGVYTYSYLNKRRFKVGVDWQARGEYAHILMASPEKALCDTIAIYRDLKNMDDMQCHLIENLRIEQEDLMDLNKERLKKIAFEYRHPTINLLYQTIHRGL